MGLKTSVVYKNLNRKIKLFGMELEDILILAFFSSIMNLLFGRTSLSFLMVFILPLIIGIILYWSKKNKSEKYLQHYILFLTLPGHFSVGESNEYDKKLKRKIYDNKY
ncbi:MAG: hypothetical protein HQK51_05560 [Oligoflexia bacterium]|nr:hypothetical protein [Oligoflexia bacterium]